MPFGTGGTGAGTYQSLSPLMRSFCASGAFACEASHRRQTPCGPDAMAGLDGLAKAALRSGASLRANIILDDTDQSDVVDMRNHKGASPRDFLSMVCTLEDAYSSEDRCHEISPTYVKIEARRRDCPLGGRIGLRCLTSYLSLENTGISNLPRSRIPTRVVSNRRTLTS